MKIVNNLGLFILRVVAGGYVLKYGLPKLRDVDGAFAKEFESLGFHPASAYVTRAGPMMLLADMVVAAVATTARAKHFDLDQHEEEALFAAIALLLALGGPGAISADSAFDLRVLDHAWQRYLSVPAALVGAAYMLSQRTPSLNA